MPSPAAKRKQASSQELENQDLCNRTIVFVRNLMAFTVQQVHQITLCDQHDSRINKPLNQALNS